MSFGGPIDSMINSNKSNLGLLKKRKRLKEIQDEYKSTHREIAESEVTEEEKKNFQKRMKISRRLDSIKRVISIVLTLIVLTFILYMVYTADYSGLIEVID